MTVLTRRSALFSAAGLGFMAASTRPASTATPAGPIRLLGNENPYGPSPAAAAAAHAAVEYAWKYVFQEEAKLKALISEREGVPLDHVLVTAGSAEGLRIAALLACGGGGEVVAANPSFPFLQLYAKRIGGTVRDVPLTRGMFHDLEAMAAAVSADTRLVYVCNPNNPTGTVLAASPLRGFIEALPDRLLTVVDEAYVDLLDEPQQASMVGLVRSGKQVMLTRTFSKIHGLAGLRVGFIIAPPALIKRAAGLRMSMSNQVSIAAASASYSDIDFQNFSRAKIREAREVLYGFCRQQGLEFTPSAANFVLVKTGSVKAFRDYLRARQILVGGNYPQYEEWCRISLGTVEQMQRFSDVAGEFFT
jgi:histidinol-phosphate aminotransferase